MLYFKVLVVMFLALVFVGCANFATLGVGSSRLSTLERESTLDKMDSVQGNTARDGSHMRRQEDLAKQEILNRDIQAKKNKGLKVELANYSRYVRGFEIRKASIFRLNPIRASFVLSADTAIIIYLMPGFYEVTCYGGNGKNNIYDWENEVTSLAIWKKTYEVTTAPSIDVISGEETHCTMGNIDDSRRHHLRRPTAKKEE